MKPSAARERTVRIVCVLVASLSFLFATTDARAAGPNTVRVGSKRFVESFILGEIVTELARQQGLDAVHETGLGGTAVVFRALEDGAIDVYPDYTGTLAETVVHDGSAHANLAVLRRALAPRGLSLSDPIGFEDTYALAARHDVATKLGLHVLSDLRMHPELRVALSHEFAGRSDGWPGLCARYGIEALTPRLLDHALAYEAISRGTADIVDVYTTDAKITRYDLVTLKDDRSFFPSYDAVLVYRTDLLQHASNFGRVLERLRGAINAETMQRLNARVELDGVPFNRVAKDFLSNQGTRTSPPSSPVRQLLVGTWEVILRHGPRHVMLVAVSLILAALLGIPLGILAHARPRLGVALLGVTGIVQTIPSLALFCFFIPIFGIGTVPALLALFLYGLLPIVRNTHAGLASIPDELREAALALGLSPGERLWHIELPLASRTVIAGIKTSAVVAVGSATIAAFIGAGGFGEPISTGLALNDVPTILEGALPAAGLALIAQGLFAILERAMVPHGLREPRC
ncbi:MAG: ABC transporter permease subunit [Polyangiaceae bacterium]|nr:ABC transporter permease subunit [Polyangiaceae bacterium]